MDKVAIHAVKIGIPGSRANAEAIAGLIGQLRLVQPDLPVVLDPVLASGAGDALARDDPRGAGAAAGAGHADRAEPAGSRCDWRSPTSRCAAQRCLITGGHARRRFGRQSLVRRGRQARMALAALARRSSTAAAARSLPPSRRGWPAATAWNRRLARRSSIATGRWKNRSPSPAASAFRCARPIQPSLFRRLHERPVPGHTQLG